MQTKDTYVKVRIDFDTKERAMNALADMGLSISDAIRLLLVRVAEEHKLPFVIKIPNSTTSKAIDELETDQGQRFDSIADMMAVLDAED